MKVSRIALKLEKTVVDTRITDLMPKFSLAKLERHLCSAADRFRQEGLDTATYKDYIFGMLFLKRCSDMFEAEHDRIVGRTGRNEEELRMQVRCLYWCHPGLQSDEGGSP